MIKVKLMKYTAEPERTVAMAARLCYSPAGAEELSEKMTDEQVTKLVEKLSAWVMLPLWNMLLLHLLLKVFLACSLIN